MPKDHSKKVTQRSKKPDISDYGVKVRYIPLEEEAENQRLKELCHLLYLEMIEDLTK
jgi:hypothetical protein